MVSSFTRKALVGLLAVTVIALVGCDKQVKLTFQNSTDQDRQLMLHGHGEGTGFLGTLPSMSKVKTTLKVDEEFLPVTYRWDAGDKEGSFVVNKDTPGKLMIVIREDGSIGPIDKNTEVNIEKEVDVPDTIVGQDTVVE